MTSVAQYLSEHGPSRSSRIVEAFVASGLSAEAARQRVSRAKPPVRSFPVPLLPKREAFLYLEKDRNGERFWQNFLRDKPANFELCIENVLEDEPDMLVDMMQQIDDPRIRLCLDIGHANAVTAKNFPVTQWIQRLAPYLAHFHLHNNDGSGDTHAAFDAGSMDMQEILQTIDRCCADDVTYTIEAREPLPCLAWLKAHQYL